MDRDFYKNRLVFNSFYRSGNIFLFLLSRRMVHYNVGAQHEPSLFLDLDVRNVVMFRNPYDCIASVIVKRRVDFGTSLPEFLESGEIENDIISAAKEYINYIKETEKNFNNIYVGNFETMIKDPIGEIKKICKFFKLSIKTDFNYNMNKIYSEIEKEMYESPGPAGSINLMTDHDGHLPREKTKERLRVEEYVKNSSIVKECYDLYTKIQYTKI